MDVFVFLSESEGSPIAILEAMAAGKAIIASKIPAIREIVRNGKEAILVDPHSMVDLKRAMLLLFNDSDLRDELARKVRERAELYDIDRVYGQMVKLYQELVVAKKNLRCYGF
jgi:glycosyltransferase involved in cell wall biosynthesis